jgi:tetratricopeptide (TPR) repeat protein
MRPLLAQFKSRVSLTRLSVIVYQYLASLGLICLGGREVVAAQEHFSRALTLHQKARDVIGEAIDYCHLGDVLYRRDDIEEAKTHYQNAYDLYGDLEKSCSRCRSLTFHRGHDDHLCQKGWAISMYHELKSALSKRLYFTGLLMTK